MESLDCVAMVSTRRPNDSEEDMPYINFDQKPVWNNEKFPMTNWTIVLPLKNGQQTRERFTVMTSHSSCFPVTEFVQPPDSNMHAEIRHLLYDEEFKNIQGTDEEFKNITGTDEEPKAKAPKVNHDKSSLSLRTQVRAKDPPIHEVSRESQQINSDVDKFLFTLMLSSEP